LNHRILQRHVTIPAAAALIAACARLAPGQFIWEGKLAPHLNRTDPGNDYSWHKGRNWNFNDDAFPGAANDVTISTQINGQPPLVHIDEAVIPGRS
jgi:hypothetical protein